MPQWLVTAYNDADPETASRRQSVRPAHLENVKALAAVSNIVVGGALLDDDGQAVGSVAVVDFQDRAALDNWLQTDPYATGRVWARIKVVPIAIAVRAPAV